MSWMRGLIGIAVAGLLAALAAVSNGAQSAEIEATLPVAGSSTASITAPPVTPSPPPAATPAPPTPAPSVTPPASAQPAPAPASKPSARAKQARQPGALIFHDDFNRSSLGSDWGVYAGAPGGDPYSWWDRRHVGLHDGKLILAGYKRDGRWTTGGVSNWPITQTYGRWEVRFRMDPSDEITVHFLLWPQREVWPPEIDFLENFGGARKSLSAFVHHMSGGSAHKIERSLNGVDLTGWHTAGVDWRPGRVDFLMDGKVWGSIEGDAVPDEPMWLGLQAQAGGCQRSADYGWPRCPDVGIPDRAEVEIDWVKVWAPQ